jgi:hypothetical protein
MNLIGAKNLLNNLLADSNTTVNRWKSYLSQLLNVHNVSDVRQTEIHTAEPQVPGPSHLEIEISIAELKRYKSPYSPQIPAEVHQAGGKTLVSVIHKLVTSIWNKEELPDQWMMKLTVIIIEGYHCYRLLLWSSGQRSWLQTQISRVRFPALPYFLSCS